jgi:hypothetical protein
MIISKVTVGFVVQQFDTDRQDWVCQDFIASDECEYETENGDPIDVKDFMLDCVISGKEPYLPYDMVQPQPEGFKEDRKSINNIP